MTRPVDRELKALAQRFGVTRLARLTGLDRSSAVEVAAAVRPFGHVLQVSQGKGMTWREAQWSALCEAIELAAAETPDLARMGFGPMPPGPTNWDAGGLSIAWIQGVRVSDATPCWVPAEAVYCPPAGMSWMGPSVTQWQSNGLGAHPHDLEAAVEHAVFEVLERDVVARALPDGWTEDLPGLLRWERMEELESDGLMGYAFELSPRGRPLSVAGVLLFDLESDVVPLTAGYACRRSWQESKRAAWLEAVQSRVTEIHGAREDVLGTTREAGLRFRSILEQLTPPGVRARLKPFTGSLRECVPNDLVVVTLREEPCVVKAVSATLKVSELL